MINNRNQHSINQIHSINEEKTSQKDISTIGYYLSDLQLNFAQFSTGDYKWIDEYIGLLAITSIFPYDIGQLIVKNLLSTQPKLGQGSFGIIYNAINLEKNQQCAIKLIRKIQIAQISSIVEEFRIQSHLNQNHSQRFLQIMLPVKIMQYGSFIDLAVELELAQLNLAEYSAAKKLSEDEFKEVFMSILEAIFIMHSQKYAHRDIKPQNILYVQGKGWVLADFGCAKQYLNQVEECEIAGTGQYHPAPLRQASHINRRVKIKQDLLENDLFAFKLTMLIIQDHNVPFYQLQEIVENNLFQEPLLIELSQLGRNFQSRQNKFINPTIIDSKILSDIQNKRSQSQSKGKPSEVTQILANLQKHRQFGIFNKFESLDQKFSEEYEQSLLLENLMLTQHVQIIWMKYSKTCFKPLKAQNLLIPTKEADIIQFGYEILCFLLKYGYPVKALDLSRQFIEQLNYSCIEIQKVQAHILMVLNDWEEVQNIIKNIELYQDSLSLENKLWLQLIKKSTTGLDLSKENIYELWEFCTKSRNEFLGCQLVYNELRNALNNQQFIYFENILKAVNLETLNLNGLYYAIQYYHKRNDERQTQQIAKIYFFKLIKYYQFNIDDPYDQHENVLQMDLLFIHEFYFEIAYVYYCLVNLQKAEKFLQFLISTSINQDSKYFKVQLVSYRDVLAQIYYQQGQLNKGMNLIKTSIAYSTTVNDQIFYKIELAKTLFKLNMFKESDETISEVEQIYNANFHYYRELCGYASMVSNKFPKKSLRILGWGILKHFYGAAKIRVEDFEILEHAYFLIFQIYFDFKLYDNLLISIKEYLVKYCSSAPLNQKRIAAYLWEIDLKIETGVGIDPWIEMQKLIERLDSSNIKQDEKQNFRRKIYKAVCSILRRVGQFDTLYCILMEYYQFMIENYGDNNKKFKKVSNLVVEITKQIKNENTQ